jgi:hypothetical protein
MAQARLAKLERLVGELEAGGEKRGRNSQMESAGERWVTQKELENRLAGLREAIRRDTELRLEANEQSMEALRKIIAETDLMLEQVLERLDAAD